MHLAFRLDQRRRRLSSDRVVDANGKHMSGTAKSKTMRAMSRNDFLMWEAASRDVIVTKRAYCDLAGDLAAGVMLSQVIFWTLPGRSAGSEQTKLRVKRGRTFWLAKARSDWWQKSDCLHEKQIVACES